MTHNASVTPHAQMVDELATQIVAFVEHRAPMDDRMADVGTEALVAALIRRVGPFGYSSLAEWIPLSRA